MSHQHTLCRNSGSASSADRPPFFMLVCIEKPFPCYELFARIFLLESFKENKRMLRWILSSEPLGAAIVHLFVSKECCKMRNRIVHRVLPAVWLASEETLRPLLSLLSIETSLLSSTTSTPFWMVETVVHLVYSDVKGDTLLTLCHILAHPTWTCQRRLLEEILQRSVAGFRCTKQQQTSLRPKLDSPLRKVPQAIAKYILSRPHWYDSHPDFLGQLIRCTALADRQIAKYCLPQRKCSEVEHLVVQLLQRGKAGRRLYNLLLAASKRCRNGTLARCTVKLESRTQRHWGFNLLC